MKHHKGMFQKGTSGNPAGRPKGSKDKNIALKQSLAKGLLGDHAQEIVGVVIDRALKGDANCLKMCIDRIIPLTRNSDGISSPKEETPNIIINVNGGSLPEILPAGQGEEVTFVKENDVIATIEQDVQGKKLQ